MLQLHLAACDRAGEKQHMEGLRGLSDFYTPNYLSQQPVNIKKDMSWFLFLFFFFFFAHAKLFKGAMLLNKWQKSWASLPGTGNELVSFFFFFFIGWDKEAEISLGSHLEFLQPLNFIAQQSIQLGLWEGSRPLKFIWYHVSGGTRELSSWLTSAAHEMQ